MRQRLARLILRAAGWRVVGHAPLQAVFVGAPHTSNWDFVLTVLVIWSLGLPLRVLMKQEVFRGPLGWVFRRCGGIPIDRSRPAGVVRELAEQAERARRDDVPFVLVIAAEGTRRKSGYWKSGFYHIAVGAGLPITMGFIDGPTRTAGFGPTFTPSGDLAADMDRIRAFFVDKHGIRPENRTEPRLREESAPP